MRPAITRIRAGFAERKIEAVIPARSNHRVKIEHDRALYKQRDHIERMFGHLRSTAPSPPAMASWPSVSLALSVSRPLDTGSILATLHRRRGPIAA